MEPPKVRTIEKADLAAICAVLGVNPREVETIQVQPRDVYVTFRAQIEDGERIVRTLHLPVAG